MQPTEELALDQLDARLEQLSWKVGITQVYLFELIVFHFHDPAFTEEQRLSVDEQVLALEGLRKVIREMRGEVAALLAWRPLEFLGFGEHPGT